MNSEIEKLLIPIGEVEVGTDFIVLRDYPFAPSSAYPSRRIEAKEIRDMSLLSAPPNMQVGDELLVLTAEKEEELKTFAQRNKVPIVDRPQIWEAILEPFLDTEYIKKAHRKSMDYLKKYGLSNKKVQELRDEVEEQMIKYNIETMLWEWLFLGLSDVLRAMQAKYGPAKFEAFYQKVMALALLEADNRYE